MLLCRYCIAHYIGRLATKLGIVVQHKTLDLGYQILERNGYKKIRRYAGGLQDWEEAGYPLEGSLVD